MSCVSSKKQAFIDYQSGVRMALNAFSVLRYVLDQEIFSPGSLNSSLPEEVREKISHLRTNLEQKCSGCCKEFPTSLESLNEYIRLNLQLGEIHAVCNTLEQKDQAKVDEVLSNFEEHLAEINNASYALSIILEDYYKLMQNIIANEDYFSYVEYVDRLQKLPVQLDAILKNKFGKNTFILDYLQQTTAGLVTQLLNAIKTQTTSTPLEAKVTRFLVNGQTEENNFVAIEKPEEFKQRLVETEAGLNALFVKLSENTNNQGLMHSILDEYLDNFFGVSTTDNPVYRPSLWDSLKSLLCDYANLNCSDKTVERYITELIIFDKAMLLIQEKVALLKDQENITLEELDGIFSEMDTLEHNFYQMVESWLSTYDKNTKDHDLYYKGSIYRNYSKICEFMETIQTQLIEQYHTKKKMWLKNTNDGGVGENKEAAEELRNSLFAEYSKFTKKIKRNAELCLFPLEKINLWVFKLMSRAKGRKLIAKLNQFDVIGVRDNWKKGKGTPKLVQSASCGRASFEEELHESPRKTKIDATYSRLSSVKTCAKSTRQFSLNNNYRFYINIPPSTYCRSFDEVLLGKEKKLTFSPPMITFAHELKHSLDQHRENHGCGPESAWSENSPDLDKLLLPYGKMYFFCMFTTEYRNIEGVSATNESSLRLEHGLSQRMGHILSTAYSYFDLEVRDTCPTTDKVLLIREERLKHAQEIAQKKYPFFFYKPNKQTALDSSVKSTARAIHHHKSGVVS